MTQELRQSRFWEHKTLQQMSSEEWEALCDGCAKCCLVKLEDEDTGEVYYTDVACRYLDQQQCRCSCYPKRLQLAPDCISLKPDMVAQFHWLPASCAYRLVAENKPLPHWHPLITGESNSAVTCGASVRGRVISEQLVDVEMLEEHIVHWVDEED